MSIGGKEHCLRMTINTLMLFFFSPFSGDFSENKKDRRKSNKVLEGIKEKGYERKRKQFSLFEAACSN